MIVTATGLNLLPLGGIELAVDAEPVRVAQRVAYQAMMLEGGDRAPWRLRQHYFKDAALFRGPIAAKELEFGRTAALTPSR